MSRLSDSGSFITSRPVAILMVVLAAVVFGYMSYGQLPVTLMPELTYPTLTVRTEYPGAAPEEVENDISRPIEEKVGVIAGLTRLSSVSRAGISDVVLEFSWNSDIAEATQAVLEKLDMVFLPDEAERPLILHYDPSLDPVMELSLSGTGRRFEGEAGLRRLRRLAELRIKTELEPVTGVAAVRVRGGLEEEIHVALDEGALRRTGISIQQVIDRLAQENINVAGGTLKEGRTEYLVRTLNEFGDIDQIGATIVATFDGRDVRVRDLGRVIMAHKEREIVTRTDGADSVQLEIYKEGDANIVALARRVKALIGDLQAQQIEAEDGEEAGEESEKKEDGDDDSKAAGSDGDRGGPMLASAGLASRLFDEEGARLEIVADRSLFIESSINQVRDTAVIGGLLAVLVLFLFLRNAVSTLIVGISIPISLVITFAPLHLLGVTLNIMSLGGLALGVGMLVDSSIVVLESIHRCKEEGDTLFAAAIRGTAEVRTAVLASTLTSIAVFFPMVFVEGLAGQAFGDLGFAVVVSLLASAGVALFFIPMLITRPGLGLSVAIAVSAVLMILAMAASAPIVPQVAAAAVFLLLGIGFCYSIVIAMMGRLETDPFTKKAMGLRRWYSLRALLASIATPVRPFRSAARRFREKRSFSSVGVSLILFIVAVPFFPLAWVYFLLRFLVGSFLEWGIGKPFLLGLLGICSLSVRFLRPALAAVFRLILLLPMKLTSWVLGSLSRAYPPVLRSALAHPVLIVLIVIGCLWGTLQVAGGLGSELLPEVHQGEFTVEVALPVGTPLEETEKVLEPIERAILDEKQHIRSLLLTLGFDSVNSQRSDEGEHTARFKVLLDKTTNMAALEEQVISRLRSKFEGVPDVDARIVRPVLFSSKTPIEVEVQGDDLTSLKVFADRTAEVMGGLPELADVESSLLRGAPEVQVVYDRNRLARYDLNARTVARLVRSKVKGFEATRFNMKDRRIPILVRLALEDRESVDDVRGMIVNPGGERPIRLDAVADVTLGEGPSEVRRIDSRRVAVVRANIASGSLSAATWQIQDSLTREIDWPADMSFFIAGQNAEWERSRKSLWIALALCVFLVYVIMASQFESLIHPLVIMLTIPLAFFGTVITLKVLGMSLSIVVFLGMIMLAGIVVNNAIVLVDYINTLRKRGMPRDEAVVTAGSVRLRPILMTTATTVLGLTPMALGLGDGAEIRTPMAIAVISGLISSTALTLLVIPSIYVLADRLKTRLVGGEHPVDADSRIEAAPAGADTVTP